MRIKHLLEMYRINSKSGNEHTLGDYVMVHLNRMGIPYTCNKLGNIYRLLPGVPIVSAHLDQVGVLPLTQCGIQGGIISGDANLGADDKNGLWICLDLLEKRPELNFIFTVQEESGGVGARAILAAHEDLLASCPYCLIFDRKGGGDIIGTSNYYCDTDLERACASIGTDYGFSPAMGVWCDADTWRDTIACVNLSCGYHNAHTEQEYTVIAELLNSAAYGLALVDGLPITKYRIAENKWVFNDSWAVDTVFCPNCYEDVRHGETICPVCFEKLPVTDEWEEDEEDEEDEVLNFAGGSWV
jgi:tripeptide aminopeptidase